MQNNPSGTTHAASTVNNTQINDRNNTQIMKIAHSNINSIRNKIDDVSANLSDYDIICISETKLSDDIQTKNLLIDSYHDPIRKDRNTNNGGGLMLYMKNNIFYKHRPDLEFNLPTNYLRNNRNK